MFFAPLFTTELKKMPKLMEVGVFEAIEVGTGSFGN